MVEEEREEVGKRERRERWRERERESERERERVEEDEKFGIKRMYSVGIEGEGERE